VIGSVAALLMVMGNYLSKTRSNFFAGIRTPWTLSSDYSWERTHRLTARLFMALGAIVLVLVLSTSVMIAAYVFVALLVSVVLAAVIMSYVYWRSDPNRHAPDLTPE
jgi:immunity protein, SdpI family